MLNAGAQRVLGAFQSPLPLPEATARLLGMPPAEVKGTAEALARVGLLRPEEEAPRPLARTSTLSAWLHVTEACTLNCPYCYVDKRPGAMDEALGRRAIDALVQMARRHGYSALKLKYAGGEPTLQFPLVRALHLYAVRRAAQAGLALDEVLLTNGVGMTDAMLAFLAAAGVQLMVSLDGGPDAHDRVRTGRDGQGTHAAVTSTVERALAQGLRPSISITLTALTLEGAGQAVDFALARALPFNLNFFRECTTGGSEPSPLVPGLAQLVAGVVSLFDRIRMAPAYPLPLTGILDRTRLDIPHDHACSAGRDYLVVGTRGQVSACQMLLPEPWTDLTVEDPLDAVRRCGELVFGTLAGDSGCDSCRWYAACGGGCPLLRDTPLHARYCQAYQILLPELVRLEGRRRLAIHSAGLFH